VERTKKKNVKKQRKKRYIGKEKKIRKRKGK